MQRETLGDLDIIVHAVQAEGFPTRPPAKPAPFRNSPWLAPATSQGCPVPRPPGETPGGQRGAIDFLLGAGALGAADPQTSAPATRELQKDNVR